MRNKFGTLISLVTSDIDILMISERKIDESFPPSQFMIDGFSVPYRRDKNAHGGGILVCFRNNITVKLLKIVKTLFSNKVRSNTYITLNENKKLLKNECQIANIFNTFFIETVPSLGTKVIEIVSIVRNLTVP